MEFADIAAWSVPKEASMKITKGTVLAGVVVMLFLAAATVSADPLQQLSPRPTGKVVTTTINIWPGFDCVMGMQPVTDIQSGAAYYVARSFSVQYQAPQFVGSAPAFPEFVCPIRIPAGSTITEISLTGEKTYINMSPGPAPDVTDPNYWVHMTIEQTSLSNGRYVPVPKPVTYDIKDWGPFSDHRLIFNVGIPTDASGLPLFLRFGVNDALPMPSDWMFTIENIQVTYK